MRFVVTKSKGAGGELDEGSQKAQTSSYKRNKSQGCHVQHGTYS